MLILLIATAAAAAAASPAPDWAPPQVLPRGVQTPGMTGGMGAVVARHASLALSQPTAVHVNGTWHLFALGTARARAAASVVLYAASTDPEGAGCAVRARRGGQPRERLVAPVLRGRTCGGDGGRRGRLDERARGPLRAC